MKISECFAGLQGEGLSLGLPCVFIRFPGCNLKCSFCDSTEQWKQSTEYSLDDIVTFIKETKIKRVVFTGGEPLLYKNIDSINAIIDSLPGSYTYEVETNGAYDVDSKVLNTLFRMEYINCSPKLSNSGELLEKRVYPDTLIRLGEMSNKTMFKFVISSEADWQEIEEDFLPYIDRRNIMLMPAATTVRELQTNGKFVWVICVQENVRATTRLQTLVWDNIPGK